MHMYDTLRYDKDVHIYVTYLHAIYLHMPRIEIIKGKNKGINFLIIVFSVYFKKPRCRKLLDPISLTMKYQRYK